MLRHPRGVVGEARRCVGRAPAAPARHPARDGEVVVRHHRRDAVLQAALDHPSVVVERGARVEARLGLDPRPLEGEAVGVQPELGEHGDVLGVAVVVVAGVAGRLVEGRVRGPLHRPDVGVDVAPFDLVAGRRRAPEEAVRKPCHGGPSCRKPDRKCRSVTRVALASAKLCIKTGAPVRRSGIGTSSVRPWPNHDGCVSTRSPRRSANGVRTAGRTRRRAWRS